MVYQVLSRAIVHDRRPSGGPLAPGGGKCCGSPRPTMSSSPMWTKGLQQTILALEERLREESLEVRHLPSWERIQWKLPEVSTHIVDALEEDKQRFK